MVTTPESDFNSNSTPPKFSIGGMVGTLNCSINSSHDFSHDNSDYQWFVDYGCREGFAHQSVLSSLCESYNGINELSYYDDIAKHLDANLAEVDIDSFRAEDMNSLLSKMPKISKTDKYCSEFDNSIYKSELLFSPVKESHISIDSLDLESYQDNGDIILTCKANKNNYTIAFEGSVLYSDESFYADTNDLHHFKHNRNFNLQSKLWNTSDNSMTKSAHSFTTWSKLKKSSNPLQRYPSGNNNTAAINLNNHHLPRCSFKKSSSLPNIKETLSNLAPESKLNEQQVCDNSRIETSSMCRIPESNSFHNNSSNQLSTSQSSEQKVTQQPAFNLVKLFIEQKSSSSDTCMDVSSGCWPSTDGSSNSSLEKDKLRKKVMKDSGRSSSICRHENKDNSENDDQSFQLDSLDICDKNLAGSKSKVNNESNNVISPKKEKNNHMCNILNNNYFNNQIDNANLNLSVNMTTKSIQTSNCAQQQARLKFIPPSFLANLNKLGVEEKAPVYVIYPNYALPDLNFVSSSSCDSNIIYTPYKPYLSSTALYKNHKHEDIAIENIKTSHIKDWKSLIVLLPLKYRKKLKHIPEANIEPDIDLSLKPMFCMSPPIKRNRTEMCDCMQYLKQNITSSTTSGSSEKPPSSGYRGSSTLMTDSELNFSNCETTPVKSNTTLQENTQRFSNVQKRTPRSILRKRPPSCSGFTIGRESNVYDKSQNVHDRNHLTNIEKRLSLPESYMYQESEIFSNDIEKQYCIERDEVLARIRAENFLSNIPKSELKYYEEIAHILNSNEIPTEKYDPSKLKTEVSKALNQKRVSFTENVYTRFATPPNSPNISVANMRLSNLNKKQKSMSHKDLSTSDQNKISSNRFKRLQIQWELLSKESSMLFELADENHTKSGGSTPVNDLPKSKIPRPVSYPTTKSKISSTLLPKPISSHREKYETPTRLPSLQPKVIPSSSSSKTRNLTTRIKKGNSNAVNPKKRNI